MLDHNSSKTDTTHVIKRNQQKLAQLLYYIHYTDAWPKLDLDDLDSMQQVRVLCQIGVSSFVFCPQKPSFVYSNYLDDQYEFFAPWHGKGKHVKMFIHVTYSLPSYNMLVMHIFAGYGNCQTSKRQKMYFTCLLP